MKNRLRYAPATLQEDASSEGSLPTSTTAVHAVSTIACANGHLAAVWYGGTREGAQDVAIYLAQYDGISWGTERALLNRAHLQKLGGPWVRRIGNPVLHQDSHGGWHLFVVTVALGGWACSRIEHLRADSLTEDFYYFQRLPIRWWPNLSHLIRAPAYNLPNHQGFVLPAYFEMGKKYGLLLHFDAQGILHRRQVLDGPKHLLQPCPVHYPDGRTGFFLRDYQGRRGGNGHIWYCEAKKDSATTAPMQALPLSNPDSGVAALANHAGGVWLARNPDTSQYPWRKALVLERLDAQLQVQQQLWVEAGTHQSTEFSYPCLSLDDSGRVHLTYTHGRKQLRHRVFVAT